MNEAQRIAYVQAQCVCAMAEIAGMQAENEQRRVSGQSPAFVYDHFVGVINTWGIGPPMSNIFLASGQ